MNKPVVFRAMLVGIAVVTLFSSLIYVAPAGAATPAATAALSAAEREGLLYMREEEKLAHDVYQALYEKWGLPSFQNITGSEATHMEEVRVLLDQVGLEDPAAGLGAGVFANKDLQALYDQMMEQGSRSLVEALKAGGAAIEEVDIRDLQERMAQTDNAGIESVYSNLLRGSENHLRAFVRNMDRRAGETYEPQYLSQDEYARIIGEGGVGRGRGRRG